MQPLFAYNALIWKNTITILTLILFVVFLVRGLYLFAVLGKHLLMAIKVFNINNKQRISETLSHRFAATFANFSTCGPLLVHQEFFF